MELNALKENIIIRARLGWNAARWLGIKAGQIELEASDPTQLESPAESIGLRPVKAVGGRSPEESHRLNWLLEAAQHGRPPIDPAVRQDMLELGVEPERINRFARTQSLREQISRSHD